jgi:hypothetical protein
MKPKHLCLILLLLAVTGASSLTRAEDLTTAKRADIQRLLETTGALSLGRQMSAYVVRHYTETLRQMRPDIPAAALDTIPPVVDEVIGANLPAFAEKMIPLYHRYFTHAEIGALLAFYQTEAGRKSIQVMPQLLQESMQMGQKWGEALGPEIQRRVKERLKKEGVEI